MALPVSTRILAGGKGDCVLLLEVPELNLIGVRDAPMKVKVFTRRHDPRRVASPLERRGG